MAHPRLHEVHPLDAPRLRDHGGTAGPDGGAGAIRNRVGAFFDALLAARDRDPLRAGRAPHAVHRLPHDDPPRRAAHRALRRLDRARKNFLQTALVVKSPVAAVFAVLLIPAAVFAASREKEDPIALNNRAVTAMNKGRFKEAIQLLQRAVQMNPEDTLVENLATAMNNLGVQYLNDTEPDKAMRWLQQAQEVRADDRINKNLAQALIMKGRFESEEGRPELAQQYFRDAVLTDPESRSAHESLGRSLYEQGRLKESLASVERALEIEDREELRGFSVKIRKQMEGEKDFFEQRGSHFRIFYSPDLPAQSVSTIAWKLDRAYESHR